MKEGIHPAYYQATVTCNCGNTFVTGSTSEDIHVEICSKLSLIHIYRAGMRCKDLYYRERKTITGKKWKRDLPDRLSWTGHRSENGARQ